MRIIIAFMAFAAGFAWAKGGQRDCPANLEPEHLYIIAEGPNPPLAGRTAIVPMDKYGRFETDGMINGTPARFFVDTGATSIVISEDHAAAIGLRLTAADFVGRAMTASGVVALARATVEKIDIGAVSITNVPVAVQRGRGMDSIALGVPFLVRLRSMEYRGGHLFLSQ